MGLVALGARGAKVLARQRRARSRQGGDLVLDRRQPRPQGLGLGAGALFFLDQRVECLARGFHVLGAWQREPRERVDVAGARVEPRRLLGQAAALQRFGEHLAAQPLGVGGNIGEGVQSLQERRGIGARAVFRARLLELPQLPLRGRQGAVGLGETPFNVAARADQFARQGQRRVRGLARQKLLHRGEAEPARRFVKRRARYARGFASSRQIVLGLAHGAEFFAQRIDLAADFEQGLVDHQLRDRRRAFGLFESLVGEFLFDAESPRHAPRATTPMSRRPRRADRRGWRAPREDCPAGAVWTPCAGRARGGRGRARSCRALRRATGVWPRPPRLSPSAAAKASAVTMASRKCLSAS